MRYDRTLDLTYGFEFLDDFIKGDSTFSSTHLLLISDYNMLIRVDYTNNSTNTLQPDTSSVKSWVDNHAGVSLSLDDSLVFFGTKNSFSNGDPVQLDIRTLNALTGSNLQLLALA